MKILITGDRNWSDIETIKHELLRFIPSQTTIIDGGARGADTIANRVALELGFTTIWEFAHWNHNSNCPKDCKEIIGKVAGIIRNKKMLDMHKPDLVLAFHLDIKNSKGTKHMIQYAKKNNVNVILIDQLIDQYDFTIPMPISKIVKINVRPGQLPKPVWDY